MKRTDAPRPWLGAVTAIVEPHGGAKAPPIAELELIAWVKEHLAHYKAPRHVRTVPSLGPAANGKVDYKGLRQLAIDHLDGR